MIPLPTMAANTQPIGHRRSIALFNTHTGESLDVCYFDQGRYDPKALNAIDAILRDHRTNDIKPIDRRLLDVMNELKTKTDTHAPFHIISGYRSPTTNEMLRQTSSGVASNSFHLKGMAIDIRLPGFKTHRLRDCCIQLQSGGVGYYPKSDFVHIDTGPVRSW
jgi:uncharacterized protein YcbK (DUF882 family)